MARQVLKGIKNVVEGNFTADTGYMYFIRKQNTSNGYLQFNGKQYGKGLPDVTSSDNLKILQVRSGEWEIVTPLVVYSGGSSTPPSSLGNLQSLRFSPPPLSAWAST